MKAPLSSVRPFALSALAALALASTGLYADPLPVGKAVLNVCSGGVSSSFADRCNSHSGYFPVNLQISNGGGCLEMCCSGDASSGYVCVSEPDSIRRVSAILTGSGFPVLALDPAPSPRVPSSAIITVTIPVVVDSK